MKDNNDNKTIDFIKNDNKDIPSNFILFLTSVLIKTRKLTKKDNEVLFYIVAGSNDHLNLNVNVKYIAKQAIMPINNVYRHLNKLEKANVIIKNDNLYYLNITDFNKY